MLYLNPGLGFGCLAAAPEEIMVEARRIAAAIGCRRAVVIVALAGFLASALLSCTRLTPEKPNAETAPDQSPVQPGSIMTYVGPGFPLDGALATTQIFDNPTSVVPDYVPAAYIALE
jgi:hypothetical protein